MADADPTPPAAGAAAAAAAGITDADIDALLAEMNKPAAAPPSPDVGPVSLNAPASERRGAAAEPAGADASLGAMPLDLPDLQRAMGDAQASSIDLLRDVDLNVKIELGRSRMLVEDVLKLAEGSIVELDKLAGDPVDVFVNDRLVARGEVLVLNDSFCVRVNEIVAGTHDAN